MKDKLQRLVCTSADLFLLRHSRHSENFARKHLTFGLTWAFLRNDPGPKNLFGEFDDFFSGCRIRRLVAKSPGLDQLAVLDSPFSASVVAFVRRIKHPGPIGAIYCLVSRTLPRTHQQPH